MNELFYSYSIEEKITNKASFSLLLLSLSLALKKTKLRLCLILYLCSSFKKKKESFIGGVGTNKLLRE